MEPMMFFSRFDTSLHVVSLRCKGKMGLLSTHDSTNRHRFFIKVPQLILILLLCICSCSGKEEPSSLFAHPNEYKKEKIVCLGRLVPGERVIQVAAPAGAILQELRVKRGDWVGKGQVIATLRDHEMLRASLDYKQKEVAVAEAQLAQVEAGEKPPLIAAQQAALARYQSELKQACSDYERKKGLYQHQAVSLTQVEEAQAKWASIDQRVREAKEQLSGLKWVRPEDVVVAQKKLAAAKAAHFQAAAEFELSSIRAPLAGKVIEINAYPGESVGSRGIVDLADTESMMVEAEVYVTDIGRVSVGKPAQVEVEGFNGAVSGIVTEIITQVNPNAVLNPDPYSFVDRRVVIARIRLDEGEKVASLINSQATVEILP
jgi:HlyD family secretion protein